MRTKKPSGVRHIVVGGERYTVNNREQEAHILHAYIAKERKVREMALLAGHEAEAKKAKTRIKLASTRAEKVEKENSYAKQLRQWDEEIITFIAMND